MLLLFLVLVLVVAFFLSKISYYLPLIETLIVPCVVPAFDSLIDQLVVNWTALPIYIVNGRESYDPRFTHALSSHGLHYTIFRPQADPDLSWKNRVTKGHGDALRQAFSQGPEDVLILEDDVLLANVTRFDYAVKTYLSQEDRRFYSLQNNGDSCSRYRFGTVAYLMNHRFYETMKTTCLIDYSQPIDMCFEALGTLKKVPFNIFHHGKLPSTSKGIREGRVLHDLGGEPLSTGHPPTFFLNKAKS